jgi:hypothetical protein
VVGEEDEVFFKKYLGYFNGADMWDLVHLSK